MQFVSRRLGRLSTGLGDRPVLLISTLGAAASYVCSESVAGWKRTHTLALVVDWWHRAPFAGSAAATSPLPKLISMMLTR